MNITPNFNQSGIGILNKYTNHEQKKFHKVYLGYGGSICDNFPLIV